MTFPDASSAARAMCPWRCGLLVPLDLVVEMASADQLGVADFFLTGRNRR